MSESQSKSIIDSVSQSVSKKQFAEKILNIVENDLVEACDADGYAETTIIVRGNVEKVLQMMDELFKEWNKDSAYHTHISLTADVYQVPDAKKIWIELTRPNESNFENIFEDDESEETFCYVLDEDDLPIRPRKSKAEEKKKEAEYVKKIKELENT